MWAEISSICLEAIVWISLVLGVLTLFEVIIEQWGQR